MSSRPSFPSPSEMLRQKLWERTSETVLQARQRLDSQLASKTGSDSEVADALASSFTEVSAALFDSARALLLLSRGQTDPDEHERKISLGLEERLRAAAKAILKLPFAHLPKNRARRIQIQAKSELNSQIANILAEFGHAGSDLEQLQFQPRQRQTTRALNRQVEILFLAADPRLTPAGHRDPRRSEHELELDEEYRAIQKQIAQGSHRDYLELTSRWAVRKQDLLDALNQKRPRIVHFSGHGTAAEGIKLLAADGTPELVGPNFLAQIFSTLRASTSVVVLNACYSRAQAEAISKIVDVTVGTEGAIDDKAAIDFSIAFYGALSNNLSVHDAFVQAEAVLSSLDPAKRPTLVVRPGVDPKSAHIIKVPDPTNYEPLGRKLKQATQQFFSRRKQHSDTLLSTANRLRDAVSTDLVNEHQGELEQLLRTPQGVADRIVQEAQEYAALLDKIGHRWSTQMTAEAIAKLTHLEETVADIEAQFQQHSTSLSAMDMTQALAAPTEVLPDLSRIAEETEALLQTSYRAAATNYNMLLEFLPGDLLQNCIVALLPVSY